MPKIMPKLMPKREIVFSDILPRERYAAARAAHRREMVKLRRARRLFLGPYASFSFESFATMRYQIQEMLFIENGGEEQFADEAAAYNPLVPQGRNLSATLLLEIDSRAARQKVLPQLAGIARQIYFRISPAPSGGKEKVPEKICGRALATAGEDEQNRAASVYFLVFDFPPPAIAFFKTPLAESGGEIFLASGHPYYRHETALGEEVRAALAADFA